MSLSNITKESIKRLALNAEQVSALTGAVLFLPIIGMICIDIVMRKWFAALPGIYELVELLMVVIVFSGLAYTECKGGHIKMEVFIALFPERLQHLLEVGGLVLTLAITTFLVLASTVATYVAYQVGESTAGLVNYPVWPAKLAVALGSLALGIRFAVQLKNQVMKFLHAPGQRGKE